MTLDHGQEQLIEIKGNERLFLVIYIHNTFKLRWCRARGLLGSQIPVTTGGFEGFESLAYKVIT